MTKRPANGRSDGRATEALVGAFFTHLSARAWEHLARVLTHDVERIGPYGDRIAGRDGYLEFLRGAVPPDYGNDVRRIAVASDGCAAFARVTEHLAYGERELHLEEAYCFVVGDDGLISRVEVFWQTPELATGGFGSATDG